MADFNQYVGLPYKTKGRDRDGVDCWGLVRLVYFEQFAIELPSFDDLYQSGEDPRISEAISREREGWISTDLAAPGDVVVLRIGGGLQHVGVIVAPGEFLHVRGGSTATIERLGSSIWKNRVEGFYRYEARAEASVTLAGRPHPLRSTRIDGLVPAGMSVAEMADFFRSASLVPGELSRSAIITIDGEVIPTDRWESTRPAPGARVEYRAIAQGDYTRQIAQIGALITAAVLAPFLVPYVGLLGFSATASLGLATAAITGVGTLLVNAIFPVRPVEQKKIETPVTQNLLQGGSNQAAPYAPIPVVLGQVRFTPPLGAQNYIESDSATSYLRTILVWGYGPLQVSDIRMGETPIAALEELEIATVTGAATDNFTQFNSLYGRDVSQSVVNLQMLSNRVSATGYTRTSNVVTVTTSSAHGYQVGWLVYFPFDTKLYIITAVPTSTTFQFAMTGANTSGPSFSVNAGPFYEQTIAGTCNRIGVTLHFPSGLRSMKVDGSSNIGDFYEFAFRALVQVRQLDPNTLAPITAWGNIQDTMAAKSTTLQPAFFNATGDAALEPVYRWTIFSVDSYSRLIVRHGAFTLNSNADPTGTLLTRLQQSSFGLNATYSRLPTIPADETELHRVCVFGNTVFSTVDRRSFSTFPITGCALTMVGLRADIASGVFTRATQETVRIGGNNEPYYKQADAFTLNINFDVPVGRWQVRVARGSESNSLSNAGVYQNFADSYFVAATGYNNDRPIAAPKPLAMSAIRVKASNQINGTADGFAGTVVSIAKDYDNVSLTWIERATRNPASLFRHVLQHPGNAQAVADAEIDLVGLAAWHDFCRVNSFMFDAVVVDTRSTLDLLRDIAAAGRASPTIRDGKWTVIIDQPRSSVAQAFTPHNSWGFEASKALPILPHAFRVAFVNSEKGYQPDEMIVYNDGYSAGNATLFESLNFPGVTTRAAIFKHARFHFAQLKLRPELYTINADLEHLICNRGDLVKLAHDIPQWGLLTGRIRTRLSSTKFLLDEVFEQVIGTAYTIRIRASNGTFQVRDLITLPTGGLQGFTRASVGTYRSGGGILLSVAAHVPRYEAGVMLIEAASTNTLFQSDNIHDAATSKFNLLTTLTTTGPNNVAASGKKMVAAIAGGTALAHFVEQSRVITTGAGVIVTQSAFVKAAELSRVRLQTTANPTTTQSVQTDFDVSSGTVVSRTTAGTATRVGDGLIAYANGWYRIWHSCTFPALDNRVLTRLMIPNAGGSQNWIGDDVSGVWAYGQQTENGNLSSYISTGAAEVTRAADDYVANAIALQTSLTAPQATDGDLFMLGLLNSESIDAIVLGIEEMENSSARLTLCDYSPAVYNSDLETVPAFNSQITLPPALLQTVISATPTISIIDSDERVMLQLTNGSYSYRIRVSYTNPAPIPALVKFVEGEISETTSLTWRKAAAPVPVGQPIYFDNLRENEVYRMRLRYVSADGRAGPFVTTVDHTVAGRATLPPSMATATLTLARVGSSVTMTLTALPGQPIDFDVYEFKVGQVRGTATGGDDTPDQIIAGTTDNFWTDPDCEIVRSTTSSATINLVRFPTPRFSSTGVVYRVACRMRDTAGNYSSASALASITITSIT